MGQDARPGAVVIGGGPAGLMAAEQLAKAGCGVILVEAKPSVGRKFLMAGKSGLNLTKEEPVDVFLRAYDRDADWLAPMILNFDARAVMDWAEGLGQTLFTGSTGRVFPEVMKASPLLRAWLARLDELGVERRVRWRWTGWEGPKLCFETAEGRQFLAPDVTVLALGGASWAQLGSDGAWAPLLEARGVALAPFAPSNVGLRIDWSSHMAPLFGQPVKGVAFHAGTQVSRGEAVVSALGLEGGGIYALGRSLREGAPLTVDLLPDLSAGEVTKRLSRPRGKTSLSNHLRKTLKLGPVRTALLMEFGRPLPTGPVQLAERLKALPITHAGLRPMDEAISTVGGICPDALDGDLMLRALPGVFCAGEMLDWDAPTGGYLLTACLATGRWAGQAAARYALSLRPAPRPA